jgi:hypothetical protein
LYWFLTPPAAVLAAAERIRPHSSADAGSDVERSALSGTFARLAAAERRYLATRDVPVGTTVAVLATRD